MQQYFFFFIIALSQKIVYKQTMSNETNAKPTKVIVKDRQGNVLAEFEPNAEESLATQCQDAGAPVPISCGVGACRTCVATCDQGLDLLDPEAVGPKMIDTEDNEILTCICGIKEDIVRPGAEICITCENL